ncbi:hypothetical protein E2320_005025 [Naja naja]|nr:hypothetical protein E2320_005025 [Naja naja]
MNTYAPPAPFNPATENWKMVHFSCFMEANDLLSQLENRKRMLFLSYCRPEVFDMAQALSKPADVQKVP